MRNNRDLWTRKGSRKVNPDLWDSILEWDNRTGERLESIGIRKPSRKQTRSLLAQTISEITNDSEFEPVEKLRGKKKLRDIFLVLRRR